MVERAVPLADGQPVADGAGDVGLRAPTASAADGPSARCAAIADAKVQPVPCVFLVAILRVRKLDEGVAVEQQVDDLVARRVTALDDDRAAPSR